MKKMMLLIVTLILLFPVTATLQEDSRVRYKKKTEIDFDEVSVDGVLKSPHGSYILEKKTSSFNPLIKLKENFDEEMVKSTEFIR